MGINKRNCLSNGGVKMDGLMNGLKYAGKWLESDLGLWK